MYTKSKFNNKATYTDIRKEMRAEIVAIKRHQDEIEHYRETMVISKACDVTHSCAHCRYYRDTMPYISRYAYGKCRKTDLQLDPFIYPPTAMCCNYYKRKRRLK